MLKTRSKSCPFAPRELPSFFTTTGQLRLPAGADREIMHSLPSFGQGTLAALSAPPISQVPWRSLEYMPSTNTRTAQHNAPVIPLCRQPVSPLSYRGITADRVTRPNRVHKCYGLHSIRPCGLFRPCLTTRVTPHRRVGDFAMNRQLPRVASQLPGSPELHLAHNSAQGL